MSVCGALLRAAGRGVSWRGPLSMVSVLGWALVLTAATGPALPQRWVTTHIGHHSGAGNNYIRPVRQSALRRAAFRRDVSRCNSDKVNHWRIHGEGRKGALLSAHTKKKLRADTLICSSKRPIESRARRLVKRKSNEKSVESVPQNLFQCRCYRHKASKMPLRSIRHEPTHVNERNTGI